MFDTAIFYDVENLLKGYSFSQQLISNLSLADVLTAVGETGRTDGIALQRAYANWSDSRLAVMRGEINELGIDPIQVFGFSREVKKNAADIQLAIDAIDIAHARPALQVFVIVSGDGGFAALAKKLHEYGKTVIGCAYRKQTNRVFQAVCDEFIWIDDPEEKSANGEDSLSGQDAAQNSLQAELHHPLNREVFTDLKRLGAFAQGTAIAKTREILDNYAQHPSGKKQLTRNGLDLTMVREALQYAIPGFQQSKLGFPKFGDYLQMVCSDTAFCVARMPQKPVAVILRTQLQDDWESLPVRETHSLDNYRNILATGVPVLRLPPPGELLVLLYWVAYQGRNEDLGNMIDRASLDCPELSAAQIKGGLLSLISIAAFERHPNDAALSEQTLSLKQELRTPEAMLQALRGSARDKLGRILAVEERLFEQLLPGTATP